MRPLGVDQETALRALETRDWPSGWRMGSSSHTIRILNSLVRRGLVETYEVPNRHTGGTTTHYRLVKERK